VERIFSPIANDKRKLVMDELKYFHKLGIICYPENNKNYLKLTKLGRRIKITILPPKKGDNK